jgi:hypothetical protein
LACLSRAINASTVGAAATGLVVFVFALTAPVLAGGVPHATKNIDAPANTNKPKRIFHNNSPKALLDLKGEVNDDDVRSKSMVRVA